MFAIRMMLSWRRCFPRISSALALMAIFVTTSDGNATTAAERRLSLIQAPHESSNSGRSVRAHWVRQIVFPGDKKSREQALALKRQYEECVRAAPPGATIKPVYEWPERSALSIKDFYLAEGAFVEYERSVSYLVSLTADMGCQLIEATQFDARGRLLSRGGLCSFDFATKTASGECRSQLSSVSTRAPARQGNASAAAGVGAILGGYTVTDEVKRIIGVPCRVVKANIGGHLITHCFAKMGSFKGFHAGAPRPNDAIALSLEDFQQGSAGIFYEGRALKVASDIVVSEGVFLPFIGLGFSISEVSDDHDEYSSDDVLREGVDE